MLYFLERKLDKLPKRWGIHPQTPVGFQWLGLCPQISKLLLSSLVLITLKLRPIVSYLSDGL